MKIIRDGKEYELTHVEMREAYCNLKREYLKDDILSKAKDMYVEISDELLEEIADHIEHGLSNNDSYWECYWMTIEDVIDEYDDED